MNKPTDKIKCSHGGILDLSSLSVEAIGGINKDSGYLIFSPHANLHLTAAALAIEHTEYFFEEMRKNIGNNEFNNFLDLTIDDSTLAGLPSEYTCAANDRKLNSIALYYFSFFLSLFCIFLF